MQKERKPKGYWTLEKCKEESLKYNSRKEWFTKSATSYDAARRNKWMPEVWQESSKLRELNKNLEDGK